MRTTAAVAGGPAGRRHSRWVPLRAVAAAVVASALVLGTSSLGSSSAVGAGSHAGADRQASHAPAADLAPPTRTTLVQAAAPRMPSRDKPVPVRWDAGSGRAQMAAGLPSPPGWYEAALGPRTKRKVLYLTFDDGPFPANTPRLLRALARHDAKATFFLMGGAAAANPGLVRRIAEEGHAIGNHTYWHPRLTNEPIAGVRDQLRRTTRAIGAAQGGCMRPPFGLINGRVAKEALRQGLQPIMWTGHIEDWRTHSTAWHVATLRRVTEPGAILLMHDRNPRSVDAVIAMLPQWQRMGYSLRALPPCRVR